MIEAGFSCSNVQWHLLRRLTGGRFRGVLSFWALLFAFTSSNLIFCNGWAFNVVSIQQKCFRFVMRQVTLKGSYTRMTPQTLSRARLHPVQVTVTVWRWVDVLKVDFLKSTLIRFVRSRKWWTWTDVGKLRDDTFVGIVRVGGEHGSRCRLRFGIRDCWRLWLKQTRWNDRKRRTVYTRDLFTASERWNIG